MKLLALLALSAVAYASAVRVHWSKVPSYSFERFEGEFKRTYASSDERNLRSSIYAQRHAAIVAHNADTSKTWKRTINEFADYTEAELKAMRGQRPYAGAALPGRKPYTSPVYTSAAIPESVDWREKGVISAVKDQGQCGSCWAHASTETIESYVAMATGDLPVLSTMQAASCSPNPKHCGGTGGCGGGTAEVVLSYVSNAGMAETWTYPYESYWGDNKACRFDNTKAYPGTPVIATTDGYIKLPQNNLTALMESIAFTGPLSISVDASKWFDYSEGVYDGCTEETVTIDHAVQLVGYGFDETVNSHYWLVRNSWSPSFGEAGYIRIKRQAVPEQFCGVDTEPLSGDGCEGGPTQVTVCGSCGILFDTCYPTGAGVV